MVMKTSKGKIHEVELVAPTLRDKNLVLIELKDARKVAEIVADLDGLTAFRVQESERDAGVHTAYENFSELVGFKRDKKRGVAIVTLERRGEDGDVHA